MLGIPKIIKKTSPAKNKTLNFIDLPPSSNHVYISSITKKPYKIKAFLD